MEIMISREKIKWGTLSEAFGTAYDIFIDQVLFLLADLQSLNLSNRCILILFLIKKFLKP
jgi:hypothetical protein